MEDVDPVKRAKLEANSPVITQMRRVLRYLDSPAVVNISHRRITLYQHCAAVGWLWGFTGGVAVAADSSITPSAPGVDVYP